MIKRIALLICLIIGISLSAHAQGVSVSGQAIVNTPTSVSGIPGNSVLQAVPGAQITVCSSSGGGIPCAPLVTIYSNAALTVVASNPITADANGNFQFFVAPNTTGYLYSQTGSGIVGQLFSILPQTTAAGGTITGTVANTQVAFGTALNAIGGSPNFTWNNANNTLTVQNPSALDGWVLANLTPATNILAQCSPIGRFRGQSWNGSASINNDFVIQNCPVNGANAGQFLQITSNLSNAGLDLHTLTVSTGQLNAGNIFPSGSVNLTTAGATSGGNVSSPFYGIGSSFWNGSAAVFSTTDINDVEGTGTNPTDTTVISNSGAFKWTGVAIGPFGLDTGAANAYVVTTTPAVALAATNKNCFNFITLNANTGASTMNASGTGVKNITDINGNALAANAILSSVIYGACYDGTEWVLLGSGVTPNNSLNNDSGEINLFNRSNVAATGVGTPIKLNTLNPAAVISTLLEFHQSGSGNQWFFDIDNDGSFVYRGSLYTYASPVNFFNPVTVEDGTPTATDITINSSVAKTQGNAFTVQNNSGPILAAMDSLNGVLYAGNKSFVTTDFTDSTSATLVAVTGLSYTLPKSRVQNVSFHCSLLYQQNTAVVADSFGIGITGTAPTQANSWGNVQITVGPPSTYAAGNLTALASTTPTAVVSFTPGVAATLYNAQLDGTIEQPSNATPGIFSVYVSTTTGTDNFIVKRGSYCTLY